MSWQQSVSGGGVPQDDRVLALVSHLAAFAGSVFPFANIVIPLAIWLVKRDESAFIGFHAKESLNFQISITIYAVVCVALMFVLVGFILILGLLVFELVVVVIAAVRAYNGEYYQYPLCLRFIN